MQKTIKFLYVGYIVQAIVNNLLPLFFVIFRKDYGVSTSKLGGLVLLNFAIQIVVDLAATKFGAKLGYRRAMLIAHTSAAFGLALITILPMIMSDAFVGLCIATIFTAIGGGLIEVMVSPLMDSIDFGSKSRAMSLLHSFYCWGQVLVVVGTTVVLSAFGDEYWFILPIIWATIPFFNIFPFIKAALPEMLPEEKREPLRHLFKTPKFLMMVVIMVSAGAFELTMSQWASFFAETGLGISKMLGDLLGPCLFAVFMGLSRIIYGFKGEKIPLETSMIICSALGVVCYVAAGLSLNVVVALLGCAVCGFSVGLMWPGTLALAGRHFKGGTAMFGVLALSGDFGCSIGPWLTGIASDVFEKNEEIIKLGNSFGLSSEQAPIKLSIFCGVIFPLIALICLIIEKRRKSNEKRKLS